MDEIDELVRRAAPPALGSHPVNAAEARAIARAIADERRPRYVRLRSGVGVALLSIGLVGVGTTAAVAGPALLSWVGWTPDAAVQRTFELSAGGDVGLCTVVARVVPEYGARLSDPEVEERTEKAREFMAGYDWSPVVATITAEDIEAGLVEEQAERQALKDRIEADGGNPADVPEPDRGGVATGLMVDEVSQVFDEAGHLAGGVSLEMAGQCGTGAAGGAE